MNAAARDLCGALTAHRTGLAIHGVIPPDVLTFCDEVIQALADLTDVAERAPLQLERTAGDPARPILLRGLALPDSGDAARCRVLIFLETLKSGPAACAAENRFQLTEREQIVVGHLSEGLTNKEIASRMAISEYTVKEHVRHLMQKTVTTTRTGLLTKILRADSSLARSPSASGRA
jgi:DNA-binding CsgD family transcriptional regulator